MLKLLSSIVVWYISSAVCNSSSKQLLSDIELPYILSTAQFSVAYVLCSLTRKYIYGAFRTPRIEMEEQQRWIYQVAIAFALGFSFINAGFHVMHVSINETLRAGEPVVSVLLAVVWLQEATVSRARLLTLVPIVSGIALSSYSNADFKFEGFVLMFAANVAFSFRSILVKRLRLKYNMSSFDILQESLKYGSILQFIASLGGVGHSPMLLYRKSWYEWNKSLLLFNAGCFFMYNGLSFYVLSQTHILTHSIANAFRRVVTILFAVYYFNLDLTALNALGMFIAATGVVSYARAMAKELAQERTAKDDIPTGIQ